MSWRTSRKSLLLRPFCTVFGTGLFPAVDTKGIQRTANDVITDTRQVFHSTASNEDDGVFLQIVALTSDVGDDLLTICQTHFGNLTKSGVRLLRRPRVNLQTNTPALRAFIEGGRLRLGRLVFSPLANELVDSGHNVSVSCKIIGTKLAFRNDLSKAGKAINEQAPEQRHETSQKTSPDWHLCRERGGNIVGDFEAARGFSRKILRTPGKAEKH